MRFCATVPRRVDTGSFHRSTLVYVTSTRYSVSLTGRTQLG